MANERENLVLPLFLPLFRDPRGERASKDVIHRLDDKISRLPVFRAAKRSAAA
jgi:hypothetical protein